MQAYSYIFEPAIKQTVNNNKTESRWEKKSTRESERKKEGVQSSALILIWTSPLNVWSENTTMLFWTDCGDCALFPQTWRNFQCGPIKKECEQYATPIRIAADTDVVYTSVRRERRWINSPASQRAANSSNTDSKEVTHRHIEKRTNSIGIHKNIYRAIKNKRIIYKYFFFFVNKLWLWNHIQNCQLIIQSQTNTTKTYNSNTTDQSYKLYI